MAKLLKDKDSTIALLAAMVNRKTETATYYNTNTVIETVTDTVAVIDTFDAYPVYETYFVDKWYRAKMTMGKDSARLNVSFDNPFQVSHERTRKGLKQELVVNVLPLNPHSRVTALKSYKVPPKRHNFVMGPELIFTNNNIAAGIGAEYRFNNVSLAGTGGYGLDGAYYNIRLRYNILNF